MADNNCFFKVLAELSDTEYFTFLFYFPLRKTKIEKCKDDQNGHNF